MTNKPKNFIDRKDRKKVKIQGRTYLDVTLDKKILHFIYEALAKYQEFISDNNEKKDLDLLIDELNEIKDELNS